MAGTSSNRGRPQGLARWSLKKPESLLPPLPAPLSPPAPLPPSRNRCLQGGTHGGNTKQATDPFPQQFSLFFLLTNRLILAGDDGKAAVQRLEADDGGGEILLPFFILPQFILLIPSGVPRRGGIKGRCTSSPGIWTGLGVHNSNPRQLLGAVRWIRCISDTAYRSFSTETRNQTSSLKNGLGFAKREDQQTRKWGSPSQTKLGPGSRFPSLSSFGGGKKPARRQGE